MSDNTDPKPTDEMSAVIDHLVTSPASHRRVLAFAGAGKSTLARQLARSHQAKGMYIVFGAEDKRRASGKFPAHITVTTAHGAVYRALVSIREHLESLESLVIP